MARWGVKHAPTVKAPYYGEAVPLTAWLDLKTILAWPVGVLILSGIVGPHLLSLSAIQLQNIL